MKPPLRPALLALLCATAFAQAPTPAATPVAPAQPPLFRAYGVRINVPDMETGLAFYTGFVGFAVESREKYPAAVTLKPDERHYTHLTLVQQPRTGIARYRKDAHSDLAIQIHDVRVWLARIAKEKLVLLDSHVRIEQVGLSIAFSDPWGGYIYTMDPSRKANPLPPEPLIYNYGIYVPINGYAKAREFWCDKLGFITQTDRFLPLDQALFSPDKQWGFMLHMREGIYPTKGDYPGYSQPIIQLATPDLDAALAKLKDAGAEILLAAPATDAFGRRYTAFREPNGIPFEVLEIK